MIQRIERFFVNMTQRIVSFCQYDSKNWTLWIWLKELNFFMSQKNSTSLFTRLKELSLLCFNMTKRIFLIWLKELNFSCLKRIERFFPFDVTQRNEPFPIRCVSKNSTFLQRKNKYDSENWTFWKSMTQRIQPSFVKWLKELYVFFFQYDSKNWTLLKHDSQIWTIFLKNVTQRIEPFFSSWDGCDSKNWTSLKNMIHSENPTLLNLFILLKELDFLRDSKTWAFF